MTTGITSHLPLPKVGNIECRDCRRRIPVLDRDPLPRGWLAIPRTRTLSGRPRRWGDKGRTVTTIGCDYVCPICADLARQRASRRISQSIA